MRAPPSELVADCGRSVERWERAWSVGALVRGIQFKTHNSENRAAHAYQPFAFLRTARICTLTNIVQRGKSITIHIQFEMISRRVRPQANPINAIQRGRIPVRKAMTQVEKMKTPAILTAKMFRKP